MRIADAQEEMRAHFHGGFYGQFVSGVLWLVSASLAVWSSPRAAIVTLVVGGFFIFPLTELLVRLGGERSVISPTNSLRHLGMQAAFVLPLSMPLLLPVGLYRLNWFYPALMILLGAHYLPFVTLYGMRMFAALAAVRGPPGNGRSYRDRHADYPSRQAFVQLPCTRWRTDIG
jgi:hypothetical protein